MAEQTKKSNIFIWIIGILLIVGIIYLIYKYLVNKPTVEASKDGLTPVYTDTVDKNRILIKGDKGNTVLALQKACNDAIDKYGYTYQKLSLDGIYGDKTDALVKQLTGGSLASGTVTISKLENYFLFGVNGAPNSTGTTTSAPTYTGAQPLPSGSGAANVTPVVTEMAANQDILKLYKNY